MASPTLPEGCIYHGPTELKDELASPGTEGNIALAVGMRSRPGTILVTFGGGSGIDTFTPQPGDEGLLWGAAQGDISRLIDVLRGQGMRSFHRIYEGLSLNVVQAADAKGGILHSPTPVLSEYLRTIDAFFVKPEYLPQRDATVPSRMA